MAYTFNLDDEFVGAEELQLMKTKQSILNKLRVRFGEIPPHEGWVPTPHDTKNLSNRRSDHPR